MAFWKNIARWRMEKPYMFAFLFLLNFITIYIFKDLLQNVSFFGFKSQKVKLIRIVSKCNTTNGEFCDLEYVADKYQGLCPYKCMRANSKELYYKIDAFLFHAPPYFKNRLIPGPGCKLPHQKYMFFNREAYLYGASGEEKRRLKEGLVFDLSLTYRRDSDIPNKNLFILEKNLQRGAAYTSNPFVSMELLQKRKPVAWMVSNCETISKRETYVKKLSKYIQVDIYGRCGNLTCSKGEDCFSMVEENYNFYLSFENTICPHYVTEKLENALKKNVVPVVYGGANYSEYTPPNSVINIEDYPNPKDLAKYLRKLVNNHTKYNAYLNWKNEYVISEKRWGGDWWCTMCEYLHTGEKYNNTYDDVVEWWGPKGLDKYCVDEKMKELQKRGKW